MPTPDARLERRIVAFGRTVEKALGERLVCCALVGSAAADDWVAGRSDLNTVVVAEPLDRSVVAALAPVAQRFAEDGFAVPLLVDPPFLARAGDVFPMELDDLRRSHRLLAGRDVLSTLAVDRRALRRQCEYEARSRVLRLRALYLLEPSAGEIESVLLETAKSVLVLLRHLLRLQGDEVGPRFAEVVEAAERRLGPLPVLRRLVAHREGTSPLAPEVFPILLGGALGESERIAGALDTLAA